MCLLEHIFWLPKNFFQPMYDSRHSERCCSRGGKTGSDFRTDTHFVHKPVRTARSVMPSPSSYFDSPTRYSTPLTPPPHSFLTSRAHSFHILAWVTPNYFCTHAITMALSLLLSFGVLSPAYFPLMVKHKYFVSDVEVWRLSCCARYEDV